MSTKYVELHRKVVEKLRERGVYYSYDSRLALFWLRNNLPKLQPDDEWLKEVLGLLDELVFLRAEGLEPRHENGQYVD